MDFPFHHIVVGGISKWEKSPGLKRNNAVDENIFSRLELGLRITPVTVTGV